MNCVTRKGVTIKGQSYDKLASLKLSDKRCRLEKSVNLMVKTIYANTPRL